MRYAERLRTLRAAARAHNPRMFVRMAVVFVLMIATTTLVNFLPSSFGLPEWSGAAVAVAYSAVFYALLVRELNGPLGRAVTMHMSGST